MHIAVFLAILAFLFVLGTMTGLAIAFFIASLLAKKHPDAAAFKAIMTNATVPPMFRPHKRGSIHLPTPDLDEAREAIIRENRDRGMDTPIAQLRDS